MKRQRSRTPSPPSPKIARLFTQESEEEGSGGSGGLSSVSSAWLSTTEESAHRVSSSNSSPIISANSTESSQIEEDLNGESSCSVEGASLHGAARTIAITDLPIAISAKFTSLVERHSAVRHQSGDKQMSPSVSDTSAPNLHPMVTHDEFVRSSPSLDNLSPLALRESPIPSSTEDLDIPVAENLSPHVPQLNILRRTEEPFASSSSSEERFMSVIRHHRQIFNERLLRTQLKLQENGHTSSAVNNTAEQSHQISPSSHTSLALSSINPTAHSNPQVVSSIPRLGSNVQDGDEVPHHSVYETSTGNLFRSTLSPSPMRVPISRPDGVNLMPRRKSHSESTVTRYVGIEGSSARSRGLATFSELRSGYQPLNTQSPPSFSSTVVSAPTNSATSSGTLDRALNSSASRRIDLMSPNVAAVPEASSLRQQQHPNLNDGTMPRMRNMYHYWSSAVVAAGDPHDMESGISSTSLNPLSQAIAASAENVTVRRGATGLSNPAVYARHVERCCGHQDVPKPFSSSDEIYQEWMEVSSVGEKNYGSLIKKAGPYILGPRIGSLPVHSIAQCFARREKTNKFYIIKILTLPDLTEETPDDQQGKMLMFTEFSLLSQLKDMKGVVQCRDFFKDKAWDPVRKCEVNRLCLLVDCLMPHDYDPESHYLINLQHHVIREKKLGEKEALIIFWDIARIVEQLHKRNIVHRDLKLGNMVVDRRTWRLTIANFCLGKHLSSEKDKLRDQRGSPAYISPDVLSGKPYYGKPSDMWALGVVLFTMLYGQFPFYDSMPQELFRKIKTAEFTIPNDGRVSDDTKELIHQLLSLDAQTRMTAGQVVDALESIIGKWKGMMACETDQLAPDIPTQTDTDFEQEGNEKATQTDQLSSQTENLVPISRQQQQASGSSNRQLMIKLESDARPMSPADIRAIRHLFTSRR